MYLINNALKEPIRVSLNNIQSDGLMSYHDSVKIRTK